MTGLKPGRAGRARAYERFCEELIDSVADEAVAVKPQVAFFEALGGPGISALERVCEAAAERGLLVIADAKRGDIGSTAQAYAEAWLAPRDGEPARRRRDHRQSLHGRRLAGAVPVRLPRRRRHVRARAHVEPGRGRPAGGA